MAFVDEVTIRSRAGKGGDGVIRWLREKGRPRGGPSGGDGGRGGDVILRGVRDISRLSQYRYIKEIRAEDGEAGKERQKHGKDGAPYIAEVPVGSVYSVDGVVRGEILSEGQEVVLLKGGAGGYGNAHFKGAENQNPFISTSGKPGEAGELHIELRLIVDCGLIGIPNAGKSSLMNALTNAKSRVGAYPFTTLAPHLGDFHGYVLADIPGLIEGASEGKGLGYAFLRHVSRTRSLLHLVSLTEEDPLAAYRTVRNELSSYDHALLQKPEAIVLTKTDAVEPARVREIEERFKAEGKPLISVSVIDDEALARFSAFLSRFLAGT